jgi:hypothetical protein
MINFNLKDHNMAVIAKLTKLTGLETKNEYRIYGLSQDGNPPLLFSAQESAISSDKEKVIGSFLAVNGIDFAFEDVEQKNKKIYIGIRRDMRNNAEICANFITTFVYYLEGRLNIPDNFKMNGIESFKTIKE